MARFTKRYSSNRLPRRRGRVGKRRRSSRRGKRRGMRTPRPGKIGYRL